MRAILAIKRAKHSASSAQESNSWLGIPQQSQMITSEDNSNGDRLRRVVGAPTTLIRFAEYVRVQLDRCCTPILTNRITHKAVELKYS
jgi:hypothetical protein